ncbi:MAG: ATP-dependent protease LonB [Candidatus Hodarchaeales archaeon]
MAETKIKKIDVDMDFETTQEIPIPSRLIDQVIGQDEPVEIIKKAAIQRRNVLLIGDPGTGKSMLGQALAELLPREELEDILCLPNQNDSHNPRIMTVPALEGRKIVDHYKQIARKADQQRNMLLLGIPALIIIVALIWFQEQLLFAFLVSLVAFFVIGQFRSRRENLVPKLLVDNSESTSAPFNDATGAHAGALLGDVRHDPFQSGGLGTPAHDRVEAGLIHKSHKGVLYIDEVATLNQKTQQQLLTAMQDKQLAITGQSELSSGAMVRTEPVPCDFVLVASGNIDTVRRMHPALRSRIRGYGYEIAVNHSMPDTMENRRKLVRFVAQEVTKDGKIPHFSRSAVLSIILEAKKRADRKHRLSLRLRDLGGLIRAAGDIAREEGVPFVEPRHVYKARNLARSLENQLADKQIEHKKEYQVIQTKGAMVGRVNGLAVLSDPTGGARGGHITPIEALVAPAQGLGGKTRATGSLRIIARESVQNVSALIKKYTGKDISKMDVHIQFLGAHGVDGDSASVTIATAIMSDLENLPVRQDLAMTGSLSIRGEVLPVGGTTAKIEGAASVGIKDVIIPASNLEDVVLDEELRKKINIIPVKTLDEVLSIALIGWDKKKHVATLLRSEDKSILSATGNPSGLPS